MTMFFRSLWCRMTGRHRGRMFNTWLGQYWKCSYCGEVVRG